MIEPVEPSPESIAPRILSRAEHNVSRKDIDPDALKVLYRLKNHGFVAYLVGGGVRDLLLERQPKDFDIGTERPPAAGASKLFRNCFIVGRRFRLCHVRFGRKVVEVSTFRRQAEPRKATRSSAATTRSARPEEDAFRRDFTVNALFYDIATFSVIDYVGGLEDLDGAGDPHDRRPRRCASARTRCACCARWRSPRGSASRSIATRLEAIRFLRGEIVQQQPRARAGGALQDPAPGRARGRRSSCCTTLGLLAYLLPEADRAIAEQGDRRSLGSLARLDDYRNAGLATPDELTNALLMGTLLVPLGVPLRRVAVVNRRGETPVEPAPEAAEPAEAEAPQERSRRRWRSSAPRRSPRRRARSRHSPRCCCRSRGATSTGCACSCRAEPAARGRTRSPRVKPARSRPGYLEDALRWLEIHGGVAGPELAAHWREPGAALRPRPANPGARGAPPGPRLPRRDAGHRRRRRRRRRRRPRSDAHRTGLTELDMALLDEDEIRHATGRRRPAGSGDGRRDRSAPGTFADFADAIAFVNRVAAARRGGGPSPRHPHPVLEGHAHAHQPRRRRAHRARLHARRLASTREGARHRGRTASSAASSRPGSATSVAWAGGRDGLDVTDAAAVVAPSRRSKPDVVFNATAYNKVDAAEAEPERAFAVNAHGPAHLARGGRGRRRAARARLDRLRLRRHAPRPYGEDDAPRPLSSTAPRSSRARRRSSPRAREHLVVRTSGVLGPGGSRREGRLVRGPHPRSAREPGSRCASSRTRPSRPRSRTSSPRRSLALARSAARGLLHVANAGSCSWHELAVASLRAAGIDAPVAAIKAAELKLPARRPMYSVLDTSRYLSLGLTRPRDWRDALGDLVAASRG